MVVLSRLFPAHETMLNHAILKCETSLDDESISGSDEEKTDYRVDETGVE